MGLKPGMRLVFNEEAPFLKAMPEVDVAQMRTALGCLVQEGTPAAQGLRGDELIEALRGRTETVIGE